MPTKKTATSTPKKKIYYPKTLPFTAENVAKVADKIFSVKNGVVSAIVLCNGELASDDRSGKTKKVVHCAVGELYHHFVSANPNRLLQILDGSDEGACPDPTDEAIQQLLDKSPFTSGKKRVQLKVALNSLIEENDNVYDDDGEGGSRSPVSNGICMRSELVANKIRKTILPLFKK